MDFYKYQIESTETTPASRLYDTLSLFLAQQNKDIFANKISAIQEKMTINAVGDLFSNLFQATVAVWVSGKWETRGSGKKIVYIAYDGENFSPMTKQRKTLTYNGKKIQGTPFHVGSILASTHYGPARNPSVQPNELPKRIFINEIDLVRIIACLEKFQNSPQIMKVRNALIQERMKYIKEQHNQGKLRQEQPIIKSYRQPTPQYQRKTSQHQYKTSKGRPLTFDYSRW